jgi:hypothetical protein
VATTSRHLLKNVVTLSGLSILVSSLLIILVGVTLDTNPLWQSILFALLGAILQTAFLGLIYEVWMRSEVEDATLEKLGTSRDVREHGLIQMKKESGIEWPTLLDGARTLCIVTRDPKSLIGRADGQIIRHAATGRLKKLVIVVPSTYWQDSRPWLSEYRERWKAGAGNAEYFAAKSDTAAAYELLLTEHRSVVLLPAVAAGKSIDDAKQIEFRETDKLGIGAWLKLQMSELVNLPAAIGSSPSPKKIQPDHQTEPAPSTTADEALS